MRLEETTYDRRETGCCARFDPTTWNEKETTWTEKPFVQGRIRSVFHIPINFGGVMTRLHRAVEAAAAYPEEPLWLSDEASPWYSNIFLAVDRDVPSMNMTRISGVFLSKTFEGPFRNMRGWMQEMTAFVASRGKKAEKFYFYYTTCPKCAKQYEKNYVVILAKIG